MEEIANSKDSDLISKWLVKHWSHNFKPVEESIKKTDRKMYELIHFLLQLGADTDPDSVKVNYTNQELLEHVEQVNAIMVQIKPGMLSIFLKKFKF